MVLGISGLLSGRDEEEIRAEGQRNRRRNMKQAFWTLSGFRVWLRGPKVRVISFFSVTLR